MPPAAPGAGLGVEDPPGRAGAPDRAWLRAAPASRANSVGAAPRARDGRARWSPIPRPRPAEPGRAAAARPRPRAQAGPSVYSETAPDGQVTSSPVPLVSRRTLMTMLHTDAVEIREHPTSLSERAPWTNRRTIRPRVPAHRGTLGGQLHVLRVLGGDDEVIQRAAGTHRALVETQRGPHRAARARPPCEAPAAEHGERPLDSRSEPQRSSAAIGSLTVTTASAPASGPSSQRTRARCRYAGRAPGLRRSRAVVDEARASARRATRPAGKVSRAWITSKQPRAAADPGEAQGCQPGRAAARPPNGPAPDRGGPAQGRRRSTDCSPPRTRPPRRGCRSARARGPEPGHTP